LFLSDKSFMDKDAIIEKLTKQVASLLERIRQLEQENVKLKERIAQLEKNSGNSSKPPSSDIVKPLKAIRRFGKKRKRGGQRGHRKFSRQPFEPEQVDEIIEYEFKGKDAEGLKPLDEWFIIQQIELPGKMYKVIEHRGRKYLDPVTGRIHIAPMPDEIRKGGLFGADVTAAIAFMKGGCHMSYTTIQQLFKELFELDISRGMLCKAAQKVSNALKPAYDQLAQCLPQELQVGVDETGHHDDGKLHWTWCFDTHDYSLFRIDSSRGSKVLEKMLGKDFSGIVCADYWGAYRKYARLFDVPVQYCMAHLIREIRFLAEHSVKKLARRFRGRAAENYFRFLTEPAVEPTNNGTERQLRPVVIDRRITQGTRGDIGMRWCERIWTILATCNKQGRNVFDFIHESVIAHWSKQKYPLLLR